MEELDRVFSQCAHKWTFQNKGGNVLQGIYREETKRKTRRDRNKTKL